MAHLFPDLVGFTDNRAFNVIPYSSVTRNGIVEAIVNTLTGVGWTKLSGPTVTANGNEYELHSQQSPWYDHDNTPVWYIGGRVYLKIYHPNSTQIFFQTAEYYNSSIEEPMNAPSERMIITVSAYNSNSGNFFVIGNPYECYVGIDISTAPDNTEFYCGALNVPGPVQEQQQVISSIICDRFRRASLMTGSTTVHSIWRTNTDGVTSWYGNPSSKASFLTITGGNSNIGNFKYQTARRLWRRDKDPTQSDPRLWQPFILPAQVSLAIDSASATPFWRGFLWDSMIIPENAVKGSYLDFIGKTWYCYGSGTGATNAYPGSLWINIGVEGITLI